MRAAVSTNDYPDSHHQPEPVTVPGKPPSKPPEIEPDKPVPVPPDQPQPFPKEPPPPAKPPIGTPEPTKPAIESKQ